MAVAVGCTVVVVATVVVVVATVVVVGGTVVVVGGTVSAVVLGDGAAGGDAAGGDAEDRVALDPDPFVAAVLLVAVVSPIAGRVVVALGR